jgi:RNA polymerase sigma-70 factor (ECF subfamily)
MDATSAPSDPVVAALNSAVVYGRLLAAARAFLGKWAKTLSGQRIMAEAEEIVSIARTELWKCRQDYNPDHDVVAWMVGFVGNATRNHLRKYARIPTGPPPDAPQLEDLVIDLGRPVADSVADQEFVERLMTQLKPDERRLIELKYNDGLTFAEIAVRTNAKENAVRVRHHRIIGQLRQWSENAGEVRS